MYWITECYWLLLSVFFCIGQTVVHKAGLYAVDNICGIFILVGNIKNMDGFSAFKDTCGRTRTGSINFASQIISNVPAAVLLSGFTENINALILGTNIGGLGTLIASMASLISYKQYALTPQSEKESICWYLPAGMLYFL